MLHGWPFGVLGWLPLAAVTVHPCVWAGRRTCVCSVSTPQLTVQILPPRWSESTHLPRPRPHPHPASVPEHHCLYLGAGKGFCPVSTLPPWPPFDLLGAALRGIPTAEESRHGPPATSRENPVPRLSLPGPVLCELCWPPPLTGDRLPSAPSLRTRGSSSGDSRFFLPITNGHFPLAEHLPPAPPPPSRRSAPGDQGRPTAWPSRPAWSPSGVVSVSLLARRF